VNGHTLEHVGHVQVGWARTLAESLLAETLPRRWAHSQGVGAQAETLRPILGPDGDLLTAAAWLHDIGYAPSLARTEFHPLDGARYLRDVERADAMLCRLVAHHTCALIEAEERGLSDELAREFAEPPERLANALIYCDMTTGPSGERITADGRLTEIHGRYGDEHLVSRSIRRATPRLLAAVASTAEGLSQASDD
jgi:hypothetical protein